VYAIELIGLIDVFWKDALFLARDLTALASAYFWGGIGWLAATKSSNAPVWVPLASIIVSGMTALLGIGRARSTAHRVAREKATLDLIEKRESTEYYISKIQLFSRLRLDIGFDHLHPRTVANSADRQSVLNYLNHYELVSLGICKRVLDGTLYQEWMGSTFVRDWNAASSFIDRMRWKRREGGGPWYYDPKPFENFERMACRWSKEAVRLRTRRHIPPADREASISDEPLPVLTEAGALQPADAS
jgi:hypothetical protein